MTEAVRDHLLPSLLDRLTDDDPQSRVEAREYRLLHTSRLRTCVLRDLVRLFNAIRHDANGNLEDYPEIRCSVLNYGLPAMSGRCVSGTDMRKLERELRQAIISFEPRLMADSITVKLQPVTNESGHHNLVSFKIKAKLWSQPAPVDMTLQTEVDLESGQWKIGEEGRAP